MLRRYELTDEEWNQIVNSGKKRLNIGNIHDRHI